MVSYDLSAYGMDPSKLLATRRHKILETRSDQLAINSLAYNGGAPYIESRLSRFPSESDVDFLGDRTTTTISLGRLQRAFLINYSKRIAHKVNQYVFKMEVERGGVDPRFEADATTTGVSLNQFMADTSTLLTTCRWCWIGIDRPPSDGARSIAAREASGDRIYWQLYNPTEVVDWCFDSRGGIAWLITERTLYLNTDPRQEPVEQKIRYLWEPNQVTRMEFSDKDGETFSAVETLPLSIGEVPFVPCGLISPDPWWFDEIERVQRAIMDLLSSRDTQIFKAVFALLVVSKSFKDQMVIDGIKTPEARRKMGVGHPLIETAEESGLTRYLTAPSEVFAIIQDAKKDLETTLYDIVGLNMSVPESRQVASAEAKAWDHMDPETVLKERATMLEEIETKAVQISTKMGGGVFKPYVPVYGKKFDISDFAADIAAITSTNGFSLPPKSEKLVQKALVNSIARRFGAPPEEVQAALEEIETYEPPTPIYIPPALPNANPDQNSATDQRPDPDSQVG